MTSGREVVEDYSHLGLTLRQHPVSFLRADMARRRIVTCADAVAERDRRWVDVAGLVLVRQRPGSAKGVMFMTIEDETGVANVVIWEKVFEQFRRIVLGAGMIGIKGRVQREGEVVHIVARELTDLSSELASVGARSATDTTPLHRAIETPDASVPEPREWKKDSDLAGSYTIVDEIRVKTRDFR